VRKAGQGQPSFGLCHGGLLGIQLRGEGCSGGKAVGDLAKVGLDRRCISGNRNRRADARQVERCLELATTEDRDGDRRRKGPALVGRLEQRLRRQAGKAERPGERKPARAAPTSALAARSSCSACMMSGRRVSRSDGVSAASAVRIGWPIRSIGSGKSVGMG